MTEQSSKHWTRELSRRLAGEEPAGLLEIPQHILPDDLPYLEVISKAYPAADIARVLQIDVVTE